MCIRDSYTPFDLHLLREANLVSMDSSFSKPNTTTSARPHKLISVVVPCMNEEESVEQFCVAIEELQAALSDCQLDFIIVDDGSSDDSVEALKQSLEDRVCFRIIEHEENQGVAAAIQTGIEAATTDIVCSMDFDCTYDPCQFTKLLPALTDDVDLVTGSPYHPQGLSLIHISEPTRPY